MDLRTLGCRLFCTALTCVAMTTILRAENSPTAPPRLIVRGDDMGFSHSGNEALVQCFREGIETSIEVLVPSPWFPEAVKLLADNPRVDVGVHLALTSEWDNVKWRPLTAAATLRDPDGYFFPMVNRNQNYPGRSLRDASVRVADVEAEFRAQIETAKRLIPRVSHLSGHMGCEHLSRDVEAVYRKLATEYHLEIDPLALGVQGCTYVGPHLTAEEKLTSFLAMLNTLEPGMTYLFVDHPGLDTPELRAIHHVGYADVAVDRQGVTSTLTHQRVRRHIESLGIQLIDYRDLVPGRR